MCYFLNLNALIALNSLLPHITHPLSDMNNKAKYFKSSKVFPFFLFVCLFAMFSQLHVIHRKKTNSSCISLHSRHHNTGKDAVWKAFLSRDSLNLKKNTNLIFSSVLKLPFHMLMNTLLSQTA